MKHSKRIRKKTAERLKDRKVKAEKVRSVIAKELVTNRRYRQKIVKDKDGNDINTFRDLIEAIQEE